MRNIAPFKLERFYSEHEFTAKYLLCSSDCETFSIADLLSMETDSIEKFVNLRLGYTEPPGSPLLRKEISGLYETITPENILVHTGAQEAIFLFLQSFLCSGDHVIVQTPCYQSFLSVPESIGCSVSEWEIELSDKWYMDFNKLKQLINDKTKLICITSPNNPTGYHLSKEELNQIILIAKENNITIFSDEVYRFLEAEEQYRLPAVSDIYENGISLGVMSKSFGLAGLRIGWVATSRKEILNCMAILKEYTSICNSGPAEFLAALALRNKKHILRRNLQILNKNLILAETFFSDREHIFQWVKPTVGPITFVKMLKDTNSNQFANELLKYEGVLLLPGEVYNRPGFFRMGFGRKNFPEAIEKLSSFLKSYSHL